MNEATPPADEPAMAALLDNYRTLIARVDSLCRQIGTDFRDRIVCREGCDSCCRHLTLFPVEAAALVLALDQLPAGEAETIRANARTARTDGPCPLISGGRCLLYQARPLICRTHGLPLLADRDGHHQIDFCPLNFRKMASLPGSAVINLDRLNELLVAVNALFCSAVAIGPERITLADALLLDLRTLREENRPPDNR